MTHLHLRMNVAPLNGKTPAQLAAVAGVPYQTVIRQMNGCQTTGRCGQTVDGRREPEISARLVAGLARTLSVPLDAVAVWVEDDGKTSGQTLKPLKQPGHKSPKALPEEPKSKKPPAKTSPEGAKSKKPPESPALSWFAKRKKDPEPHGKQAAGGEWEAWEVRQMLHSGKKMTDRRAGVIAETAALAEAAAGLLDGKHFGRRVDEIRARLLAGKRIK